MQEITIKPNQRRTFRFRIFFLLGFFLVVLLLILLKISYIQIVQKEKYSKYAKGQMQQRISLRASRGLIFDRKDNVIVDNRLAFSLYITPAYLPKDAKKRQYLIQYLAKHLKISVKKLKKKITIKNPKKQNPYSPILIKRDLDINFTTEFYENGSDFRGVEITKLPMRQYKMKDNLSHILGYTGIIDSKAWTELQKTYSENSENPYKDKDIIIGKRGMEQDLDEILRGKDGIGIRHINSRGQLVESEKIKVPKKRIPGHNIYLTIDTQLQSFAKKLLKKNRGVVIVSKPHTGEILALVSNPSFDPNAFSKRERKKIHQISTNPDKPLFARAFQSTYPPSSVFKVIVAIAALEGNKNTKKVSPYKKFTCIGAVTTGDRYFRCHGIHGTLNMLQAIEKSCNAYFYQLGSEIGWDVIHEYGSKFKLGQIYKLDAGTEIKGILPSRPWKKKMFKENWYTGDTLNHSIGQGYTLLPPIKVHNIMSAIANEGKLIKPRLILKIHNPETNTTQETKIETFDKNKKDIKLVSRKTLKTVQQALRAVAVTGTAKHFCKLSEKFPMAGKTGTAQNPDKLPHAWFSGYAPFNAKPEDRIAITVFIENIEGGGGLNAAPIATAIVKFYLERLTIEEIRTQMPGYELTDEEAENNKTESKTGGIVDHISVKPPPLDNIITTINILPPGKQAKPVIVNYIKEKQKQAQAIALNNLEANTDLSNSKNNAEEKEFPKKQPEERTSTSARSSQPNVEQVRNAINLPNNRNNRETLQSQLTREQSKKPNQVQQKKPILRDTTQSRTDRPKRNRSNPAQREQITNDRQDRADLDRQRREDLERKRRKKAQNRQQEIEQRRKEKKRRENEKRKREKSEQKRRDQLRRLELEREKVDASIRREREKQKKIRKTKQVDLFKKPKKPKGSSTKQESDRIKNLIYTEEKKIKKQLEKEIDN